MLRAVPRDGETRTQRKIRFGSSASSALPIRSRGQDVPFFEDLYHKVLAMPWWRFFAYTTAGWLGTNFFFAMLYSLPPGRVAHAAAGEDAFYFPLQTLPATCRD